MAFSNSSLAKAKYLSPNHSGTRTHSIDRITPHCVVGQFSGAGIGGCFKSASRQASCNYGIGTAGDIVLIVEEKNRSWCSSSKANDQRAVTIECASNTTHPYAMNASVYSSLVKLCVDICKRNGKKKLIWFGDKTKSLNYNPAPAEMVLTVHRWFANKACPGDWLYSRLGSLAAEVTKQLSGSSGSTPATKPTPAPAPASGAFLVKVSISNLWIRKGAGTNTAKIKYIKPGVYTIVETKAGVGSSTGWGRLKSGEGWISLDYAIRTSGSSSGSTTPAKKSIDIIAAEVIAGKWGNGATRKKKLEAAGYNYSQVKAAVNKKLKK